MFVGTPSAESLHSSHESVKNPHDPTQAKSPACKTNEKNNNRTIKPAAPEKEKLKEQRTPLQRDTLGDTRCT
jgi:hypothetical protein